MPKLSESELQTALLDALHEYIGSDSVRDAVAVILPIIEQHIRAAPITPTQTSAQQGWVTNPGDTGYGRIKAAWDSAQQERK